MDIFTLVMTVINVVIVPLVSTVGFLLWNKITTIERVIHTEHARIWAEVKAVEEEISCVRGNYLTRFDEIKDLLHNYHLQSIEKISILETLLKEHIK